MDLATHPHRSNSNSNSSNSSSDDSVDGLLVEDEDISTSVTASIISDNQSTSPASARRGSDCIVFCCCRPCFNKQRREGSSSSSSPAAAAAVGEALVALEKALIVLSVVSFLLSMFCACFYALFLAFFVVDLAVVILGFVGSITRRKSLVRVFYGVSVLFVAVFVAAMFLVAICVFRSAFKHGGIALLQWKQSTKAAKRLRYITYYFDFDSDASGSGDDDDDDGDDGGNRSGDDDDDDADSATTTLVCVLYILVVAFFVIDIVCRIKVIKAAKNTVMAMNNEEYENDGSSGDNGGITLRTIGDTPSQSPDYDRSVNNSNRSSSSMSTK